MTRRRRTFSCHWAAGLLAALAISQGAVAAPNIENDVGTLPAKGHWAFVPPQKEAVPPGIHPVDFFVAQKLSELGLRPAPEADRPTLLRRLTLDLTGLPPTPEELAAFLSDTEPGAYERQVARLLESPHYGERWGRFWLDLARWAESDGYEANALRSSAWRYRDYVVNAFNKDKPYDRFLCEQIAGDELETYADEHIVATGFLAAARNNNNEEDKAVQLNEPLVDMANTTASVTLGLTLGCAQCHDHKFEPLTTRDYYAWHGLFLRGQANALFLQDTALVAAWEKTFPSELGPAKQQLEQRTLPTHKELSEDDQKLVAELKKKIAALEKKLAETRPQTWGFYSPATSPHTISNLPPRGQYPFAYRPEALKKAQPAVLNRGNVASRGEAVATGVPTVLGDAKQGTRLELAHWLASESNPLTARVWVNYVWQQHFGRGLVETPGDFGLKGARPTNQLLLDWLACDLRERGWSTKRLHRLLVTSAAYRRASLPDPENARRDPSNDYLWRWTPRRLEAEAISDSMLAVAGQLDTTAGGPSDPPDKPSRRRSIYRLHRRLQLPEGQLFFDAPAANESCPRRHVSTVPLQPLYLLNNETNIKLAGQFAARVQSLAGEDPSRRAIAAFRLALSREPDDDERTVAIGFFARRLAASTESSRDALADFCQSIMNLNEFVYLP